MRKLLEQMRRHQNYVYWVRAENRNYKQRLWYDGYYECLKHVISLLKEEIDHAK